MKKILALVVSATLALSMVACSANIKNATNISETYNGITKTETTSVVNGKTVAETVYTDKDGNVLDPEIGKAAFEAAKAGDTDPLKTVQGETETAAETEDTAADEEVYVASVTFVNDTDENITELYLALADDTSWGSNVLEDGMVLEPGDEYTFDGTLTYAPDTAFQMDFVTENGDDNETNDFDFSGLDDPENVTITITYSDGAYHISIA